MSVFRRLSTTRLLALLGSVAAAALLTGAIAVVASGGGGEKPPQEPLAQAAHDALVAPEPQGVTARIAFTNNLLPSGNLLGNATSPLISGATGRLWTTPDGSGRIELQSDAGDAQVTWTSDKVSIYDASSNTVYEYALSQSSSADGDTKDTPPTLADVTDALTKAGEHALLSEALPDNIAGQPAYSVTATPKQNPGLVGQGQLSWDATHGIPLRVAVTAKGSDAPVLELKATDIAFAAVPANDVTIAPPAGAKVVDLKEQTSGGADEKSVTGLANVRAAVPFTLVAPASVGGQTLSSARTAGTGALLTYGEGLGALVVHQAAADKEAAGSTSPFGSLPKVTVGSATGHELETPLGTVLTFDQGGVSFLVGGSITKADAETAARAFAG